MSVEDRLRGRLQETASSMPVGSGSVAGVQARAAQLQRRSKAARGGIGALALVAVAGIGFVTLRGGQAVEFATSLETESQSEAVALPAAGSAAVSESVGEQESADEAENGLNAEALAGAVPAESAQSDDEVAEAPIENAAAAADSDDVRRAEAPEAEPPQESEMTLPSGDSAEPAVFATAVKVVMPPEGVEADDLRYSFSGTFVAARGTAGWFAFDGASWHSVGLPDDMEVVAVDLSGPGRIAAFGVIRPLECDRAQVLAVRTDEQWSYVRVDDDTPPMVGWELLDARIRVTDTGIELERAERLWLDDQCADAFESEAPTDAAADLAAELEVEGDTRRNSWLYAPFGGGFADRWPHVARADAHAAAASRGDLPWTTMSPPEFARHAGMQASGRSEIGSSAKLALHEATIWNVLTTMHVSHGFATLQRGEQSWEVCPIHADELDSVNGEIGRAGEHLAVVVRTPRQTLYLVERAP